MQLWPQALLVMERSYDCNGEVLSLMHSYNPEVVKLSLLCKTAGDFQAWPAGHTLQNIKSERVSSLLERVLLAR